MPGWVRVAQTIDSSSNLHAEGKRAASHGPGATWVQFVAGMHQNEWFSTGKFNVSQRQHIEVISSPFPFKSSPGWKVIRLKPSGGKADRSPMDLAAFSGLREEKKEVAGKR